MPCRRVGKEIYEVIDAIKQDKPCLGLFFDIEGMV
jgi:hypothetical protein